MNYKIFNIPVPESQSEISQLNQFLNGIKVVSCIKELVTVDKAVFWSFVIEYYSDPKKSFPHQPIKKEGVDYREVLSEEDFAIFSKLRDIRKTLAETHGVPVYAIFSNDQLAQMVTTKCIAKNQLSTISGIGKKKLEQYAPPMLEFLTSIFTK